MNRDPHADTIESSAAFAAICAGAVLLAFVTCMHFAFNHATPAGCSTDTECMQMHGGDGGPESEVCIALEPTPMQSPILRPGMLIECRATMRDGSTIRKVGM